MTRHPQNEEAAEQDKPNEQDKLRISLGSQHIINSIMSENRSPNRAASPRRGGVIFSGSRGVEVQRNVLLLVVIVMVALSVDIMQVRNTSSAIHNNDDRDYTVAKDVSSSAAASGAAPGVVVDTDEIASSVVAQLKAFFNNNNMPQLSNSVAAMQPSISNQAPGIDQVKRREVNMLYGLYGALDGFLEEWKISLKSMLYHAPLDADLHIHVMCNNEACGAVKNIVNEELKLPETKWRNQIRITAYNVTKYESEWANFLFNTTKSTNMDQRVTFGGLYRLYAHRVIPEVTHAVYLDNEIIITTNLNGLLPEMNDTTIFQFGENLCSGFMILNLPLMHRFWELLGRLQLNFIGDQHMITSVHKRFGKDTTGHLSQQWSVHLAETRNTLWTLHDEPAAGILHFNGIRSNALTFWSDGLDYYCDRIDACKNSPDKRQKVHESWGLADYYIRIPWQWVKSMGAGMIPPGEEGKMLQFRMLIPPLLADRG